jgi:uncharacterized membrane protein
MLPRAKKYFFSGLAIFLPFVLTNYFGRAIHRLTEKMVLRIPLMSSIYPAFKITVSGGVVDPYVHVPDENPA